MSIDEDDDEEDSVGSQTPASIGSPGVSEKTYKPGGAIVRVEVSRSGVKIRYADGGREEIQNGTYELRNPGGQRIERRHAKGSDIARLKAMSSRVSIRSVTRRDTKNEDIESIEASSTSIQVTYSNGWKEEVTERTYRLVDPYGRTAAIRPATRVDRNRLRKLARSN